MKCKNDKMHGTKNYGNSVKLLLILQWLLIPQTATHTYAFIKLYLYPNTGSEKWKN
jgi:hypothetical protein